MSKIERIWELDAFRGVAILIMIWFHTLYDLKDIFGYNVDYESFLMYIIAKFAGNLFIMIAGLSCVLSRSNFKRGLRTFLFAVAITLVTFIFDKTMYVKFGILHFFGISMMIFPLFKNMKARYLVVVGVVIIILGNIFTKLTLNTDIFFMFNLTSSNFQSSDYYPLLPWFGVFLLGAAVGKTFYKEKKSIFNFRIKDNPISFLGRHSLTVYIVHQPIIMLILYTINSFKA